MSTVEPPGPGPDPLLRADRAPTPRTLVDVLRATADDHPDSPAIDNGREVLTYDELLSSAADVATALRDEGVGRGDRVGVRIPSGTTDLYVAIVGILLAGAAYVPVDHDDPDERARLVFNEAGVAAVVTADLVILSTEDAARAGTRGGPRPHRRRLDHLHLGLDRHPEGRGRQPPQRRRLRRRRGADVPAGQADQARATASWPA